MAAKRMHSIKCPTKETVDEELRVTQENVNVIKSHNFKTIKQKVGGKGKWDFV